MISVLFSKDILFEIFTFLNEKDLCRSGQVSQYWQITANDNRLWKYLYAMRFDNEQVLARDCMIKLIFADRYHQIKIHVKNGSGRDPKECYWRKTDIKTSCIFFIPSKSTVNYLFQKITQEVGFEVKELTLSDQVFPRWQPEMTLQEFLKKRVQKLEVTMFVDAFEPD